MNELLAPWIVVAAGAGLVLAGVLVGWLLANERALYRHMRETTGETIDFARIADALQTPKAQGRPPRSMRSQPWW